ncbi:MAG: SCP2 sterol-binding domain-containing protein [Verrucomicrobiota bacterium]
MKNTFGRRRLESTARKRRGRKVFALILSCFLVALLPAAEVENRIPQDVFDGMRDSFRPERARGVHLRFQFDLSGPQGGKWWIEVENGVARQGRGAIAHPDVTFIASDRDWVALSNHRLSGVWATVTGRLKIHGSQLSARKLDEMFP